MFGGGSLIVGMGEVQKPGVYELRGAATVLEAIALAGGFGPFASPGKIAIIRRDGRGHTTKLRFDYHRAVAASADPKITVSQSGRHRRRAVTAARLLDVVRRRRTLAVVAFTLVIAATVPLAYALSDVWRARAVILVDPRQMPDAFVKSTIIADWDRQVRALSQWHVRM